MSGEKTSHMTHVDTQLVRLTVGVNLLHESHHACTLCCRHKLASRKAPKPTSSPSTAGKTHTTLIIKHRSCQLTGRVSEGEEEFSMAAITAPTTATNTR